MASGLCVLPPHNTSIEFPYSGQWVPRTTILRLWVTNLIHFFYYFIYLLYLSLTLTIIISLHTSTSCEYTLLSPSTVEYIGSLAVASFPKYPYDDDDDGDDFINKLTLPHLTPFTHPQRPFRPLPLVWCPQRYYCYCCCCHYCYSLPLGRLKLVPQRLKRKRETIFSARAW